LLLEDELATGRFREDLYYRLNVVPIYLPPLRERREDIAALARFFLGRYSEENRRDPPELTADVLRVLESQDWPGNVRQLENCIERAVVLADGKGLTPALLAPPDKRLQVAAPARAGVADVPDLIRQLVRIGIQKLSEGTLETQIVGGVERELIEQVLKLHQEVQVKAAKHLGINRNTLHKKLSEYSKPTDGAPAAPNRDQSS